MNDSRNNQTENGKNKFYLKVICLFLSALCFIVLYILLGLNYSGFFSDIARNLWLLFFAIFGGGLAIWGRKATQTQLENTREQLENSAEINRNDRFAKAVELLGKKEDKISSVGGLYMLRDLAHENPKTEYVRCIEIVSKWFLEHDGFEVEGYLLYIAVKIFKIKEIEELDIDNLQKIILEKAIRDYKDENGTTFWPYLESVNLSNANLQDTYLGGAYLHKANLMDTNLQDADLGGAYLQYANLQGANLKDAYLGGAYLHKANLINTNLQDADLGGANLQYANLQGANLKDAYLGDTDLRNADLQGANLKDANLEQANLEGAILQGANLKDVYLQDANLINTNLMFSSLIGSGLMQAHLQDANLVNANLTGANLTGAAFAGANLTNADMRIIEDLTKEQILSAKWIRFSDNSKPPELPDDLMEDPDVQEWLSQPTPKKTQKPKN